MVLSRNTKKEWRLLEGNECQLNDNGYYQHRCKFTAKYEKTKNFNMSQKTRNILSL